MKSVMTVLTLLTERGHNRLHNNWGKKTLCRSTPRRPGSSLFKLRPHVSRTDCSKFSCRKILCCKYFVAENVRAFNFCMAAAHTKIF